MEKLKQTVEVPKKSIHIMQTLESGLMKLFGENIYDPTIRTFCNALIQGGPVMCVRT